MHGNQLERFIRPTAILLWLVVGATVLARRSGSPNFQPWAISWSIGFAASLFSYLARVRIGWALVAVLLQGLMVAAMTALLYNGYEGLLLVPTALELWFRLRPIPASIAALALTLLFGVGVAVHVRGKVWTGCMLALPYAGLQVLVLAASVAFQREKALRTELANAHQELHALGPLLDQGSRNAERVRLSRELHDATGHRLTALALQLEVASHVANAAAQTPIETAKGMVRGLIDDVHRIVTATDLTDSEGLVDALRDLARNFPRPAVHLSLPEPLRLADAERAHVLLRCSQEILTNSARHSGANNLWLEISQDDRELRLHAFDDGTVEGSLRDGGGLRGMRGRLEGVGGSFRCEPNAQGGLEIFASVPNSTE